MPDNDNNWNVTDNRDIWDKFTRKVVERRLSEPPAFDFFSAGEQSILEAFCRRLIPQDDREDKVPVAPFIDQALAGNLKKGYRYEEMPWQQVMWSRGLAGLDQTANERHGRVFVELSLAEQDEIVSSLAKGDLSGGIWDGLPARGFFTEAIKTVAMIYYAHPLAWNEIDFGGPAYPRGYYKLGCGEREVFEPPME